MKSLEERLRALPEDAEMREIHADDALRRRILNAAREKPAAKARLVPVLAAALVLMIGLSAGVIALRKPPVREAAVMNAADTEPAAAKLADAEPALLETAAMEAAAMEAAETETEESAVLLSAQAAGSSPALDPNAMQGYLDVRSGTAQIRSASATTYGGIWAQGNGANFPLIGLNGRYYRMLEIENISSGVLGGVIGQVDVFTSEPALAGGGVVSNTVGQGGRVYAVSGMDSALVAAEVDGRLRVFQRVSYSGASVIGSETLADTLRCSGRVTAMELGGVGTVSGQDAADLMRTLLNGAVYQGAACAETGQNLLIYLDNGLVLQMSVKGEKLGACGTWACPDFLNAFAQKAN